MTRLDRKAPPRASSRACRPSPTPRPRGVPTRRRACHSHHGARGSVVPPFQRSYTEEQERRVKELLGVFEKPFPKPEPAPPKPSKLTYKAISAETGVRQSAVSWIASLNNICPPTRAGIPRTGRPKGEGKKFSPHREPAYRLFEEKKTPSQAAQALGIFRQQAAAFFREWTEKKKQQKPATDDDKK